MKAEAIALLALSLASCASANGIQQGLHILSEVTVKKVEVPSVYSGVIASYVELDVVKDEESTVLLYPYFEEEAVLPNVGSRCNFKYEEQKVEGLAGGVFLKSQTAKVVESFDCE